jgi:hypothetical protein
VLDVQIQCVCVKTSTNFCPKFLKIGFSNSTGPATVSGVDVNSTHTQGVTSAVPAASTLVSDDKADDVTDEASSYEASVEAAASSSGSASAKPNTRPLSALPQIRFNPISERYRLKQLPAGSKRYIITQDHLKQIGSKTFCKKKPLFCPDGRKFCNRPCKKNF